MFERSFTRQLPKGRIVMSFIKTKDGTEIYYKDWGEGPAVTFSHGWPLNSDMWDGQMLFLEQNGFRVIAHDRRGHGRSSQASTGNDMDGYADDLAAVFEDLRAKLFKDRSQTYKEFAVPFYGANRPDANVSQGVLDQFWTWSMQSGLKNSCGSVQSLLRDFTEDLQKFD